MSAPVGGPTLSGLIPGIAVPVPRVDPVPEPPGAVGPLRPGYPGPLRPGVAGAASGILPTPVPISAAAHRGADAAAGAQATAGASGRGLRRHHRGRQHQRCRRSQNLDLYFHAHSLPRNPAAIGVLLCKFPSSGFGSVHGVREIPVARNHLISNRSHRPDRPQTEDWLARNEALEIRTPRDPRDGRPRRSRRMRSGGRSAGVRQVLRRCPGVRSRSQPAGMPRRLPQCGVGARADRAEIPDPRAVRGRLRR